MSHLKDNKKQPGYKISNFINKIWDLGEETGKKLMNNKFFSQPTGYHYTFLSFLNKSYEISFLLEYGKKTN